MEPMTQDLVSALLKERRRDRLWRNIRSLAWLALIATVVANLLITSHTPSTTGGSDGHGYVALIRLNGMIAPGSGFSAEQVLPALQEAFGDHDAKGVILDINSGGGTPVQASIIHDEVIKLKNKYHKKVIVVGEDMLASGAYFVAVSGDKIYVNPNTVTGSIGVIMEGFGFDEVIKKLGVDRRVIASGAHKDRFDPFMPVLPEDKIKLQSVIDEVHQNFNQVVMQGRQGRLHATPEELFTGDFWTGTSALKLGLVDGLGNLSDVMQTEFNVTSYKDYSDNNNFLKMLTDQLSSFLSLPLGMTQSRLLEKI